MNIVIIPALNPDNKLIELINGLKSNNINNIIVIDDGSDSKEIFNSLEKMGIVVIHHDYNHGKGAALKTALKESSKFFKDIKGYIQADADGQHSIEDITNIYNLLDKKIIFGIRDFKGNVPLRSKIGNKFSSLFLYITTGMKLNDTQTGLRAFPYKYKDYLLNIKGDRFEYEMNVLKKIAKDKITILKVPIKTIYYNNNSESKFHFIKDSFRIYYKLFIFIFILLIVCLIFIIF